MRIVERSSSTEISDLLFLHASCRDNFHRGERGTRIYGVGTVMFPVEASLGVSTCEASKLSGAAAQI